MSVISVSSLNGQYVSTAEAGTVKKILELQGKVDYVNNNCLYFFNNSSPILLLHVFFLAKIYPYDLRTKRGPANVATSLAIPNRRIERVDDPDRANHGLFIKNPQTLAKSTRTSSLSFFCKPPP
jgi:hypothetical protein